MKPGSSLPPTSFFLFQLLLYLHLSAYHLQNIIDFIKIKMEHLKGVHTKYWMLIKDQLKIWYQFFFYISLKMSTFDIETVRRHISIYANLPIVLCRDIEREYREITKCTVVLKRYRLQYLLRNIHVGVI